jgi:hypothetical protein
MVGGDGNSSCRSSSFGVVNGGGLLHPQHGLASV